MKTEYYVMTRLNLSKGGAKVWSAKRWGEYKRYAMPSLKAQTDKNFYAVIIIDKKTEQKLKDEINKTMKVNFKWYMVVEDEAKGRFKEGEPDCGTWRKQFVEDVPKHKFIITTRLDSDDFLLPTYMENVKKNLVRERPQIIDSDSQIGVDIETGNFFVAKAKVPSEALSYNEEGKDFQTGYVYPHTKLKKRAKVITKVEGPLWVKRFSSKAKTYKEWMDSNEVFNEGKIINYNNAMKKFKEKKLI